MAQNTILAVGTSSTTSTDVVLAAGSTACIGMFVTTGTIDDKAEGRIYVDTPGADNLIYKLTVNDPFRVIGGPCTLRAVRQDGFTYGFYSET